MKTNYKKTLDKQYEQAQHMECPPKSKLEFIGSDIFEFTTYQNSMDAKFAEWMLEVCKSVLLGDTFGYIEKSDENYERYLLMCNMPFLQGKLDWGGSIRGAWFDEYGTYGHKEDYHIGQLTVPKHEIKQFIMDLLEWSKQEFTTDWRTKPTINKTER